MLLGQAVHALGLLRPPQHNRQERKCGSTAMEFLLARLLALMCIWSTKTWCTSGRHAHVCWWV